ncbi:hypothetical protein Emag_002832 [Eimeria magna]
MDEAPGASRGRGDPEHPSCLQRVFIMLGAPRSLRGSASLWGPRCNAGSRSKSTAVVAKRGPFEPIERPNAFACGNPLKPGLLCRVWRRALSVSVLERSIQCTSAATSAAGAPAAAQLPASAHPGAAPASLDDSSSSSSSSGSCERAAKGPLNVVDMAEEGDILRGLKVGPLTWTGEGSIHLLLRRAGLYETFAFPRLLPGETVTLRVLGLWPKKGKCKAALLGTELPAPGHRLPPCPHFFQGCTGCQLLHLEYAHQLRAKQQLLQQLLQEIVDEQHQHQQSQLRQQQKDAAPVDVGYLEATLCEAGFAARGDFLVKAEGSTIRLGLPSTTGTGGLISVQRCLRLAGPLQEVYAHLVEALLPLLESRVLRPLHPRSSSGCLSGMTLRLAGRLRRMLSLHVCWLSAAHEAVAEPCSHTVVVSGCCALEHLFLDSESMSKSESQVLIRLRGQLEEAARPALLQLVETLAFRLPSLKAVTFQDLRRTRQPDEVLLGSDSILMTVLGRTFRITGKPSFNKLLSGIDACKQVEASNERATRLSFSGSQGMMRRVAAAIGQAVGTDTGGKRLWTALECGGIFALLLARYFRQLGMVLHWRAGMSQLPWPQNQAFGGGKMLFQAQSSLR